MHHNNHRLVIGNLNINSISSKFGVAGVLDVSSNPLKSRIKSSSKQTEINALHHKPIKMVIQQGGKTHQATQPGCYKRYN